MWHCTWSVWRIEIIKICCKTFWNNHWIEEMLLISTLYIFFFTFSQNPRWMNSHGRLLMHFDNKAAIYLYGAFEWEWLLLLFVSFSVCCLGQHETERKKKYLKHNNIIHDQNPFSTRYLVFVLANFHSIYFEP